MHYAVEIWHFNKAWVKGDLEQGTSLCKREFFKTRKKAKEYMESQLAQKKGEKSTDWHRGNQASYAYCWTGVTWINENSGEECEEYYQFILKKEK